MDSVDKAYQEWVKTGILTDNDVIVKMMYGRFMSIANASVCIPEYKLMSDHAYLKARTLRDILIARGVDVSTL